MSVETFNQREVKCMNTPNTTAPSRVEIGKDWTLTHDTDGCSFRNEAENLSLGIGTKHSRGLFDAIAAMNRPASPQQAPVRSAEVAQALKWMENSYQTLGRYTQQFADIVLPYIKSLEAHSPVNTGPSAPAGVEVLLEEVLTWMHDASWQEGNHRQMLQDKKWEFRNKLAAISSSVGVTVKQTEASS